MSLSEEETYTVQPMSEYDFYWLLVISDWETIKIARGFERVDRLRSC